MTKSIHLRWLRLKRQTRMNGPAAAQRRRAAYAPLPIYTEVVPGSLTASLRPALQ